MIAPWGVSVTCANRTSAEHCRCPEEEFPAQTSWVREAFLGEVTVDRYPKACLCPELLSDGTCRESLMSGHTEDVGLRVLAKVNEISANHPTHGSWEVKAGQALRRLTAPHSACCPPRN